MFRTNDALHSFSISSKGVLFGLKESVYINLFLNSKCKNMLMDNSLF